ncbi:co-chaperone YbbN [Piscinibacter sp. HJYY11]|uniref:thioredoxin family protein n=1 Tax=Piscinibacter sp. HJYY11 TaxID=2801333 RepID=UPI00191F5CD0|nr:thioredoxin family protein [Piscinibacter sp. HJYY11]MBL0729734.1 thioredoxin family protein [Piscinibacter sp. HJYY11]
MSDTPSSSAPLLVACLCAEWCGTCRDYRGIFEEAAQAHADMRFVWVDIEDESELVDPVEVENFPTLLVSDADGVRFFGTVLPHKDTLWRLLRNERERGRAGAHPDADVQALARRLWSRR